MNKNLGRLFISVFVMVALSLVAFVPAHAEDGTHELITIPVDDAWVWVGAENPCGFNLYFTSVGNMKLNVWYDEEGIKIKEMQIDGNLKTTLSANGKTVDFQDQGPKTSFLVEYMENGEHGFQTNRGTMGLITVPGIGRLFSGGGLFIEEWIIIYDPFDVPYYTSSLRGNIANVDNLWEEFQPVCEYFSP